MLRGAIDLHLHGDPDVYIERLSDWFELAKQAREVGMRAIVAKSHHALTANCAYLVRKMVPGIEVFGGICLDRPVGGLNVYAVETAMKFRFDGQSLCKIVWMPTHDAAGHIMKTKSKRKGISILGNEGLVPEIEEILNIIAKCGAILATGHLSIEETKKLVEEAKNKGMEKILINHPESHTVQISIEDQKELAELGAYLEHNFSGCTPMAMTTTPAKIAEAIKVVGAEHCVIATGLGQAYNPPPVEGFRMFVCSLLANGITRSEIELMAKKNPAKLLGL